VSDKKQLLATEHQRGRTHLVANVYLIVSEEGITMKRFTLSTARRALHVSAVLGLFAASPVAAQTIDELVKGLTEQATGKGPDNTSGSARDDGIQEGQRFYFAPTFGFYVPTEDLMKLLKGGTVKQQPGLMIGGRMGLSLTRRIGLQVTGTYVPSNDLLGLEDVDQSDDASLFFGAGKVALFVLPSTSPISLQLNGGIALVNRSGAAFRNLKNRNSVGATVGGQVGIRLGPLPPLQLAVDTYLYKQNLDGLTDERGEPASQKDVQLSIGVGLPIGQ
jgi:hypothetical protein